MNNSAPIQEKIDFIEKLGQALHRYGTNAYQLEAALSTVSERIGLNGQFFSAPTMLISYIKSEGRYVTVLERTSPGEIHLENISLVNEIADLVVEGKMTAKAAADRIDYLSTKKSRYSIITTILAFGFVSLGLCTLLRAAWIDLIPCFIIGTVIGSLSIYAGKNPNFERIYTFLSAFMAAIMAGIFQYFFPTISTDKVILAGMVILMPGLSITISMAELATKNFVSGTARLLGAGVSLFKIIFGGVVGAKLITYFGIVSVHVDVPPVPMWMEWLGVIITALCLVVLFQARPKDWIYIVVAGICVVISYKLGFEYLSADLGPFTGGLIIGAGSNLMARFFNRPISITLFPGILFLVPGWVSFQSISFIYRKEFATGIDNAFSVMIIAIAIVAGLFFGNILVNPKRIL